MWLLLVTKWLVAAAEILGGHPDALLRGGGGGAGRNLALVPAAGRAAGGVNVANQPRFAVLVPGAR